MRTLYCAFRCLLAGFVAFGISTLLFFLGAGWLLSLPAEEPAKADVVVALGGLPDRLELALTLLNSGMVSHVIAVNPDGATRKKLLDRYGANGPVSMEDRPKNTWQEAEAVSDWVRRRGWKRVLVVSDPPHLLRVKYACASALGDTDASLRLISTRPEWWSAFGWWRQPQSFQYVGSEWVKLGYYVLHYGYGLGFAPGQLDKGLLASASVQDR